MGTVEDIKNPVVVLVHGAWHTAAAFDLVTPIFSEQNYETLAIQLPSVDIRPPLVDTSADIATVRSHVTKILDEDDRDVVIISHSYGAIPATDGVKGLDKKTREKDGRRTSVVALVYISGVLPVKGKNCAESVADDQNVLEIKYLDDGNSIALNPIEAFYDDVEPTLAERAVKQLKTQSRTMLSPLIYETYRDIPSAYIHCEIDKALLIARQQALAGAAGIVTRETLYSAHSPFLSQPQQTVDSVIRVLAKLASS